MEKIILVGLGNPGSKFEGTRHNAGIMAVREWVERCLPDGQKGWSVKNDEQAEVAEVAAGEKKVFAVFPLTFMNDSGVAVKQIRDYYQIPVDKVIVVHDDMEVAAGEIKVGQGGSAKGHNGLRSVAQVLGDDNFYRVKIGIGRPEAGVEPRDFVLAKFTEAEDIRLLLAQADNVIEDLVQKL